MAPPRAVLLGTGISAAAREVDNHMLARIMETSDQWIRERSGIVTRYYVDEGTGSTDLGTEAARASLVEGEEVDYLVCATMTPDHYFPGSGTLIQARLGLTLPPGAGHPPAMRPASNAPATPMACRSSTP